MEANEKVRHLFSARYDDQLEGSAARAFDETLEQDGELAHEFEQFAEVIDLVRGLPRPTADPDFVTKVSRRIKRRRLGRRRTRREQPSVPLLGTLTTIFALVLVVAIGFVTYSFGSEIRPLEPAPATLGAGGSSLHAVLQGDSARASQLFAEALEAGLVQRVTHTEPGAQFQVEVDEARLASFLDWIGQRSTLSIGAAPAGAAAGGVAMEIVVTSAP